MPRASTLTCKVCEQSFPCPRRRGKQPECCSDACRTVAHAQSRQGCVARYLAKKARGEPIGAAEKNPLTADRHYSDAEAEFLKAMDALKRKVPFPTWSQVLQVVRELGYRKAAEPTELPKPPTEET